MAFSCVRVCFEIGHAASLRTKYTTDGFTHDWEVYVRGADGADISHFVERVVFTLHETFLNSRRVVREPPYSVRESGYAGFELPIDIFFRNIDEPRRVTYIYDLTLQPSGEPISRSKKEWFTFVNPSEELRRKLINGGGTGVTGSDAATGPAGGNDRELERPKIKPEKQPKDTFVGVFGQPIRRPEQSKAKHNKAKHIPRKEVRDKPKKQSPSSSKSSKRSSSPKKASSPPPTKRAPSPKRHPSPKRAATPPKRPTTPKRAASPSSKKAPPAKVARLEKEVKEKKKDKKEKRGKEDRSKERKAEKETSHKKHKKRDKKRRSPSEEKKREPSPPPVVVVTPPPPPVPEKPPAKQPLKMLLAELTDPDSSDSESVQSEEEPTPPPPPPPPKAVEPARDEPRFTPAYVSELRALQQRIMSLESNAELQQVVRMISQTGRFEITKKTFDFDLCALDRATVQRLMDLLHPPLSSAS